MRSQKLTIYILVALVLGIAAGYALNTTLADHQSAARVAGYISLLSDIFLRLIKMIIAPLVFCTLVAGIAKMGSAGAIGRIGAKALGWFVCADPARLQHREQRSRLPETDGEAGGVPDQRQDHRLRPADGLFVQSGRLDDVLHLRGHLHRPGLRHRAVDRSAAHDAADPDADQQRDGRRPARLAGGGHRHAQPVFKIPEAGVLPLLLGIDQFLDMARSATNVVGNSLATAVIAKWEHEEVAPAEPVAEEVRMPLAARG